MNQMTMSVPAKKEWGLVVHSALQGVGVLANLSVDMIEDLRTACDEAYNLLTHQSRAATHISMHCELVDGLLKIRLRAERAQCTQQCEPVDPEVANLIIGTFVTDVHLEGDSCGIYSVKMAVPAETT